MKKKVVLLVVVAMMISILAAPVLAHYDNYGQPRTMGFWAGPNGQRLITAGDLAELRELPLRNEDGSDFDPFTPLDVQAFLRDSRATNMANMLSAQLCAMSLNRYHEFINWDDTLDDPVLGTHDLGWFRLAAFVELEIHSDTRVHGADSEFRAYQEQLKNAIDDANNGKNYTPIYL